MEHLRYKGTNGLSNTAAGVTSKKDEIHHFPEKHAISLARQGHYERIGTTETIECPRPLPVKERPKTGGKCNQCPHTVFVPAAGPVDGCADCPPPETIEPKGETTELDANGEISIELEDSDPED